MQHETEGTVFNVASIFINFLLNPFENVFLWVIIKLYVFDFGNYNIEMRDTFSSVWEKWHCKF